MAKQGGLKTFFSKGQGRRFKFIPDDFNPFASLAGDIEDFAQKWKKGKVNIFLAFGNIGLDEEALKKAYPGIGPSLAGLKTSKRNLGTVIQLRDALKGIEELLDIKNPKTRKKLQKIAKQAYINVVPKALDAYLTSKNARQIAAVGGAKPTNTGIKHAQVKNYFSSSGKGQYAKLWEQVKDIILDGIGKSGRTKYLKTTSTGIQSFSMKDLMSIEIKRSKSKYRSVFMMEEFGTGQLVDPPQRIYQSKGSTFYKVPPYLISAVAGKLGKKQLTAATAAWFITSGALAYAEGQYALYLKTRGNPKKKGIAEQALVNLKKKLDTWTYGYADMPFKGRTPLHLFFEKGKIAKAIRDIQFKAQQEFVKVLNEEIKKFAPEFPGLVATLVQ